MRSHALLTILAATSICAAQDLNGNFTQDSLERRNGAPDCNHNGFIDAVDVARPHFSLAPDHLNGLEGFLSEVYDACPIDLDLDGDLDLATISHPDPDFGFLTFWRNEGGPGLTYLHRRTIGFQLGSVRAADLNGDGRSDLVVSDTAEERVHVLLATGDASFGAAVTLLGAPSVNGTGALALGDLDNDGDVDIVSPQVGTRTVCVYRNNGLGGFSPRENYPADFTPWAAAIGDFTGDGLPDIAVANNYLIGAPFGTNGTVTLLRNIGAAFTVHATLAMPTNSGPFGVMRPMPRDLALNDVDHDGDLDLIVSSDVSQRLDLFRNSGGAFGPAQMLASGFYLGCRANRVVCTDLDGDGWDDLVWSDVEAHAITVLRNNAGTFEIQAGFSAGSHTGAGIASADFTGDGLADIVSSNGTSRTFSVLVNQGGFRFDAARRYRPAQYPAQTLLGDFTGDGLTDMAFMLQTQTAVQGVGVFAGLGDARFAAAPILTNNPLISGQLHTRDVNHDGRLDIIELVGRCNVLLGNGDGTFQPRIVNPPIVLLRNVITDVNRDSHLDLVWISPGHPGQLYRSLGDGAGHFGPTVMVGEVPAEDEAIWFGDLNADGAPEIFTGHRQGLAIPGGVFSVYPNSGDGTFGTREDRFIVAQPLSPAIGAIACADFDQDGDNDVVVSAMGLRLYRNPGDGALPQVPELVSPASASILTAADIDRDGVTDLYARGVTASAVISRGDGSFHPPMFMHAIDSNARGMIVGDLDNDTRPDVLIEPENSWDKYAFLNHAPASLDRNANAIPDDCEPGLACDPDANCDGSADQGDLACLILAIAGDASCLCSGDGDFNTDGSADQGDLADLILVIAGGPCP